MPPHTAMRWQIPGFGTVSSRPTSVPLTFFTETMALWAFLSSTMDLLTWWLHFPLSSEDYYLHDNKRNKGSTAGDAHQHSRPMKYKYSARSSESGLESPEFSLFSSIHHTVTSLTGIQRTFPTTHTLFYPGCANQLLDSAGTPRPSIEISDSTSGELQRGTSICTTGMYY